MRTLWLVAVIAAVVVAAIASVAIGARDVGWNDIVEGVRGGTANIGQAAVNKRVPRTVLALLIGGSLGVSGAVMQGVTRNPLADPGILGVNMGAALAVVTGIAWFGLTSATSQIWVAIFGASCTALLVYVIGSLGPGGATPLKLALAGTATAITLSAFISAVVLPRGDIILNVRSWQIGGVGGATFDSTSNVLPFLIVGLLLSVISAGSLNALALGDELAAGLGERVMVARIIASLGAVMLCAAATAVAGPIGFVGLVVPHMCRMLIGVDYRWILPFSALIGAVLLTMADVIGRIIARPDEIPVGILTSVIGAPFFIWVVRQRKVREL